jgi:hypothetical protein
MEIEGYFSLPHFRELTIVVSTWNGNVTWHWEIALLMVD